jgi:NACHT domain
MDHWLQSTLGLNVAEATLIVAFLTLIVGVPAAVPPVRSALKRGYWRLFLWSGATKRSYERWFLAKHSKIQNIYLNRIEELDLAQTYVSLSFIAPDLDHEQRVTATTMLADPESNHVMIVGDPGTGKSTLLNAYGAGILQRKVPLGRSDLKFIAQSREVPFLIKVRHFAPYADSTNSLAQYLTNEILTKQAKVRGAQTFLQRLLERHHCLILVDGLDEVADDRYNAVRSAITEFISNDDTSFPTSNSRIIVSCRRQNFLRIQTDWIPTFCRSAYVLAPLRDPDIFNFLLKRKTEFTTPRTPEAFFSSIKSSGTIDLHRVPLILTISLGLYLQLAAYEIPRSVGKFYEATINELLIRHDFRGDSMGRLNRYNADDKYRFLREFAFAMATRTDSFEDFDFNDITNFATDVIPKMSHIQLQDANDFVREIIDRSGILTRISDEDDYIFAHRSIQEYLIAIQLQRDAKSGAEFLLLRADAPEWRQVILFFGALDHQFVEPFLKGLAERNLELAGHCLAGAGPISDDVADNILSQLVDSVLNTESTTVNLAALVSVTGAQKQSTRARAIMVLPHVISSLLGLPDLVTVFGSDSEGTLRLLQALAETGSAQIAATVPALLGAVLIDDERAVGVLWRCLAAPGMESEEASVDIVKRLLSMVMQKTSFEELQSQPAYEPSFMTNNLRKEVYPFENGIDCNSNLVTLLGWMEHLGVKVDQPNRYLDVMQADTSAFRSVERDKQRRTFTLRPFKAARTISLAGPFVAAVSAALFIILSGGSGWRRFDFTGNWFSSVAVYLAPGLLATLLAGVLAQIDPITRTLKWYFVDGYKGIGASLILSWMDKSNIVFGSGEFLWDRDTIILGIVAEVVTLPYAVLVMLPVTIGTISIYLPIATLIILLAFWLPGTGMCSKESVLYIRRPNRNVDMYDDSRSRHWIVATKNQPGKQGSFARRRFT